MPRTYSHLEQTPDIRLELVEDLSPPDAGGFLHLVRRRYVAVYPDGSRSQPFLYDAVGRRALDVVVIAAYYKQNDDWFVYLRSSVRPPLLMREPERLPLTPFASSGTLWELPAGLVEAHEQTESGVVQAAQRELLEEIGCDVDVERLRSLGPNTFPAPGMVGEQHIYFAVEVDPNSRKEPGLDGSALEHGGHVIAVRLSQALAACDSGELQDGKSELALRRLQARLK